MLGFNAEKSHRIVDMRECHILRPELFALVQPLREMLADLLEPEANRRSPADAVDQGADVLAQGRAPPTGLPRSSS